MSKDANARKLTEKERQFCYNYIHNGNIKESAIRAGFSIEPEKYGTRLLAREDVNDEIQKLYKFKRKNLSHQACCGYERLAFGSISDAVRLLYAENPTQELLEKMDLFNISEIKRLKDGAMEIKFFDRLRAIEKLQESGMNNENEVIPFYRALEQGAKALNQSDDSLEE